MENKKTRNKNKAIETFSRDSSGPAAAHSLDTSPERSAAIETFSRDSSGPAADIEYIRSQIYSCISEYEIEFNCSVQSLKQLQFNHVLEYLCNRVIKPLDIDYKNPDIIYNYSEIYISICRYSNKSTSLYGLSIFLNIDYHLLYSLKDSKIYSIYYDCTNKRYIEKNSINNYRYYHKDSKIIELPNNLFKQVYEKIRADREHALTDKTEDGSVMSLALGKIEYSWIESAKEKIQVETIQKYQLPQDILKKYSDN